MGLAGPKNRTKISADPNNTTWSKSTDRFGHKILLKQGWTPGSYLGAKDANHSSHYTAANASHIRVAVKDDNLGLGAKRGKAENETFGLTAFQGLLGRLNGKSDGELKKEESTARDLKLSLYQNQRWGSVRFVSGGLLVGDKIEKLKEKDNTTAIKPAKESSAELQTIGAEKSEKKRKRTEDDAPKLKKKKRKSDLKKELEGSSQEESEAPVSKKSKSKKLEKSKDDEPSTDNGVSSSASTEEKADNEKRDKKARREAKKALKLERLARKEARRLEKEKRRQKKEKKEESDSESSSSDDEATSRNTSTPASGTATPTTSFAGGRLAVRQRYIAQKKKASMDPQALKEIFMIKAGA
ncbi:putative g-patch RNA maturation protein [Botryosphaeria dothidea]|uniref:PinX1-related protein 1 n=1 Tax=Botryosphaeria dothidea TaxID=55169 RepID=A0A8H4J2A2_9PEZI|nr:putative g-patch RNA maturation protein [Botryosphaeria dothidea]